MRLIATMSLARARSKTRNAAIIAVVPSSTPALVADALDRGAHDVLQSGFCAEELSLRLTAQLHRKARSDRLRDSVRDGLKAAVRDPMTGLYNRRYALPQLSAISRDAAQSGKSFAVMLADLDFFKQINDEFGHPIGDAVLTETAKRLAAQLQPGDMIARIGGEEFLIVLQDTDQQTATQAARELCREINSRPFQCPGLACPIDVTISIGVVISPTTGYGSDPSVDQNAATLIGQADRALYNAKGSGRNKVSLVRTAA